MKSVFRSILLPVAVFAAAMLPPAIYAQGFGGFAGFNMGGITEEDSDTPTEITANSADIDLENMVITLVGDVVVDDTVNRITCDKMEIYLEQDAADTLIGTAEKPEDSSDANREEQANGKASETKDSGTEAAAAEKGDPEENGDDEEKKNIRKIICIGNVICTKRAGKDDPDGQDQIAVSGNAEYDVLKDTIILTKAHSNPESVIPKAVFDEMAKQVRSNDIEKNPVMMQGTNWMVGESFTVLIKENNRLKIRGMRFSYIGDAIFSTEKDGKEKESATSTLVSSDEADIDLERNLITLTGNVDVEEESNKITCRKMVITLKEKEAAGKDAEQASGSRTDNAAPDKDISKIVCTGEVVFRKHADGSDGEDQIAMSERADYDAVTETILMTGSPVMMQGSNKMHGERIEIFSREDNRMKVQTAKAYLSGRLLSSDEEDVPGVPRTMVSASTADIMPNEKVTLSKNVVVDDGSGRITCSEMEIFLRKDASNPLFTAGKQTKADSADGKSSDEPQNDVSRIVCSGDVVYRKKADGQEQVVLARKADYDAVNESIVMSGAHSNPKSVVSAKAYDEIVRAFGTSSAKPGTPGGSFDRYSILMQGENWIAGNPITIHPKEGNRLKATDMKAGLRRSSRPETNEEGK